MISKYDFFQEKIVSPKATKDGYYKENKLTSIWSEDYSGIIAQTGRQKSDVGPIDNSYFAAFGFLAIDLDPIDKKLIAKAIFNFYLNNTPATHSGSIIVKAGNDIFSDPLDGDSDNSKFSEMEEIAIFDYDAEKEGWKTLLIPYRFFKEGKNLDVLFSFSGSVGNNETVIWMKSAMEHQNKPYLQILLNSNSSMAIGR